MMSKYLQVFYSGLANKVVVSGLVVTTSNFLVGVINYAYQILMGRYLQPFEFALFASVLSIVGVFSGPGNAYAVFVTREVARLRTVVGNAVLHYYFLRLFKRICFIGLLVVGLVFFLRFILAEYLGTANLTIVYLFAVIAALSCLFFPTMATLQGMQRFKTLSFLNLGVSGIKLLSSLMFVFFGLGAVGALSGVALSIIFFVTSAVVVVFTLRKPLTTPDKSILAGTTFISTLIFPIMLSNLSFAVVTQADIAIINSMFEADQAAEFAAAALLAKAILYLPGGVIVVLLPLIVESDNLDGSSNRSEKILLTALALTIFMSVGAASFYLLFGDFLIDLFYGNKYAGAGDILKIYGLAFIPLAAIWVGEYYMLAKGKVFFGWILLFVAPTQVGLIYTVADNIKEAVWIITVIGYCTAIVGFSTFFFILRKRLWN